MATRIFGQVFFDPMVERPILVLGVPAQRFDEVVHGVFAQRVELGTKPELRHELADALMLVTERVHGRGVKRSDEGK